MDCYALDLISSIFSGAAGLKAFMYNTLLAYSDNAFT